MRVVIDTNVLVSGLLSPSGASGEIVRMAASGLLQLCYDARIFSEYRNVLLRPKFSFATGHVDVLLGQIKACGRVAATAPLVKRLPDPMDEPFLEAALAEKIVCLVSRNLRHYPAKSREGVLVVSPAQFLEIYRKSRDIPMPYEQ